MKQLGIVCVLLAIMAGCSSVPRTFQPTQPLASREFSHQTFDRVLKSHVHDGRVNYAALRIDPQFSVYLVELNRLDPNMLPSRNDRLAFWINAYNAFAIKGIVDGYSPNSTLGRYQYFISQEYYVGGELITLNDLEKELLIPDFQEPRIHFAIVCASQSCPKLHSQVYRAADLEQQLDRMAREFINDPNKNWFDQDKKVAYLSKIFDWFEEDFEKAAGSLLNYIKQYVGDPDVVTGLETSAYHIEFLAYDWGLNGTPPFPEGSHARLN